MPLVLCLQVISDADFVLANSDAPRRNTSPLMKQGLASDRDLPGLQSHVCKRAYVVKDDALEEGDIDIFIVNGDAYIKELGNKCLISHNEAYKPIPLRSTDSIYCCGRVLGVVEE